MGSGSQKVKDILDSLGILDSVTIRDIPESTRTSKEAAESIGCDVSEIAKSILFKGENTGKPIMVIASGINRVDENKVESLVNEKVIKADADFVKEKTGFAIGGVPPVSKNDGREDIVKFIDKDLLKYKTVWAAAGTPNSVFSIAPNLLVEATRGKVADVS